MKCECDNVEVGSHANSVILETPPHMSHFEKPICADRCLVDELRYLWSHGIVTTASCCGHGDPDGAMILVAREHSEWMRALGYRDHPARPDDHPDGWFVPQGMPDAILDEREACAEELKRLSRLHRSDGNEDAAQALDEAADVIRYCRGGE